MIFPVKAFYRLFIVIKQIFFSHLFYYFFAQKKEILNN
jgi:hypothetical protein